MYNQSEQKLFSTNQETKQKSWVACLFPLLTLAVAFVFFPRLELVASVFSSLGPSLCSDWFIALTSLNKNPSQLPTQSPREFVSTFTAENTPRARLSYIFSEFRDWKKYLYYVLHLTQIVSRQLLPLNLIFSSVFKVFIFIACPDVHPIFFFWFWDQFKLYAFECEAFSMIAFVRVSI